MEWSIKILRRNYIDFLVKRIGEYTNEFDSLKDIDKVYDYYANPYTNIAWNIVDKYHLSEEFWDNHVLRHITNVLDIYEFIEYFEDKVKDGTFADAICYNTTLYTSIYHLLDAMFKIELEFDLGREVLFTYFPERVKRKKNNNVDE